MSKLGKRIGVAVSRSLARADTIIAIVALFFAGRASSSGSWVVAILLSVIGVVFFVASGDFSWRKGFSAGTRSAKS